MTTAKERELEREVAQFALSGGFLEIMPSGATMSTGQREWIHHSRIEEMIWTQDQTVSGAPYVLMVKMAPPSHPHNPDYLWRQVVMAA